MAMNYRSMSVTLLAMIAAALVMANGCSVADRRPGPTLGPGEPRRIVEEEPKIADFVKRFGDLTVDGWSDRSFGVFWPYFINQLTFTASPAPGRPGYSQVRLFDQVVVVDTRLERCGAQREALERFLERESSWDKPTTSADRARLHSPSVDGEGDESRRHGFLKCASKVMWDMAETVDDRATFEWAVWHARWMVEATPGGRGYRSFVLGGETFEARVRELRAGWMGQPGR